MIKKRLTVVVALVLALGLMGNTVFAEGCEKGSKQCAMDKGGSKCEKDKGDLEAKFCDKAQFFMKNKEELGFSDDQITKIKDIKSSNKKDMIRLDAEIEILALDIKSALYAETIDTNALNALVDKKYDLKKEKAKALVGAYAALKEIPTKEQKEKMKALWKKCDKKSEKKCEMKSGKKSEKEKVQ